MPDAPAVPPPARRPWLKRLAWAVVAAFLLLNAMAVMQARSMTRFSASGTRTRQPEKLSLVDKAKVLLCGPTVPRPRNTLDPVRYGLGLETIRYPSSPGVELEAWRTAAAPQKPLALLFHGYNSSRDTLLRAAVEFDTRGFEVWLVDFRGSGGSSGNTTSIGWHEADDVTATIRAAKGETNRRVLLYGQSMGAAAILRSVALGTAPPDAVVVECPFDRLSSTISHRFDAMRIPAFPMAPLLTFWGGRLQGFDGFAHNPVEYAKAVKCPTLLMMGEHDTRVGLPAGRAVADALGSHGTFHIFKGRRHAFLLQDATAEWERTVDNFLAPLRPAWTTP